MFLCFLIVIPQIHYLSLLILAEIICSASTNQSSPDPVRHLDRDLKGSYGYIGSQCVMTLVCAQK